MSRTAQAPALHEYILRAQLEQWPDARDQWDEFAMELANVAQAREALGEQAEVLRGFDIGNADAAELDLLAAAVSDAEAAGLFDTAARLVEVRVAVRPFDELAPEDLLIGALWDGPREAIFLQRALSVRAYVAAKSDPPGPIERMAALDESLTLAEVLSWQGGTLEYVYAWRIATSALALERSLLRLAPVRDDVWLRTLDERIRRFEHDFAPATHAIGGDRIVTLDSLERMHTVGGHLDDRRAAEWDGVMASMGFDQDEYRGPLEDSLAWLDRFVQAANASARASGAAIVEADAALDALHTAFVDLGDGPGERWPALMITLSEYAQPIAWGRRTRIESAGTRVAIAIERYRLVHDQLPGSLDDLGDLLPDGLHVDPVTEQPWHYARQGETYALASRALTGWQGDAEAGDPLGGLSIVDQAP
ncbi:MAG: hypothetical protein RIE32_13485 [Phycisphaerales bacterium]